MKILSSKLTTPHTTGSIERERLLSLMSESVKKRLTTVVAGAGYGKTTLVAQAISDCNIQAVWYRLDESDRDLATFLSYLVAGIRIYHPEFGAATLKHLRDVLNPVNGFQPVVRIFLGEIEDFIRKDAIIVLDDHHSVKESREIRQLIEMLLKDLPPWVHLILISRSEPALPLSRLRAMREITDIREEDLAFTGAEIEQLYSEVFDIKLNKANIHAIHHKMGGWISGLILIRHSLKGKSSEEIAETLLNLSGSHRVIFAYLKENIYGALSSELQEFLIRTSIFPRIQAPFCDRLLNIDYSLDVLKYLEDNHLFTSYIDKGGHWYSYHQLFRDFLLTRLEQKLDQESVAGLHRDAAALLEKTGETDEAIRHYLLAKEFRRAGNLLKHAGKQMFTQGRFQLLSSYLDEIPSNLLNENPWLLYLLALLAGLRGKHRDAVEMHDKALRCFLEQNDEEGVQNCLVDLGLVHFHVGNLEKARKKFQELLDRNNLDHRLRIEILGYLIYISSYSGDMGFADQCTDNALILLKDMNDADLENKCLEWIYFYIGFRYAFSGDHAKVLDVAEYIQAVSRNSGPYRYPLGFYLLVSLTCYALNLHSKGYEIAREALNILKDGPQRDMTAPDWHFPRWSPLGQRERGLPDTFFPWILCYCAGNACEMGKTAEALTDAGESLRCFRKMGFRHGEAFTYIVLSRTHFKSGNTAAAEQCARAGIEAVQGFEWLRVELLLKLNLSEFLIDKGEFKEALQLLEETEKRVMGALIIARINLLYARLHWSNNQEDKGLHRLVSALEICERHEHDPLLIPEKHWIIPPLVEVFAQGGMQKYIADVIAGMEPDDRTALVRLRDNGNPVTREAASVLLKGLTRSSPSGLQIQLLGRFSVRCNGKEIPDGRWKSRKAKMLFQFLAFSRPRGTLNKEILMELLWPEEDPAITVKRFHVALASLRKSLEPEIVAGVSSSYIFRTGDSYGINLGHEGWVDTEKFSEELRCARQKSDPEASIPHLLNAESRYGGNFLEEEPYCEWCSEVREKLKMDYLHAIRRIVAYYEGKANFTQCMEYAEKYLEIDIYAEDIYRSLMVCYWETGDKFRMVRAFRKCRDDIMTKLNCGLSEETEQLYQRLLASRRG
ncbi:MAG: hypothetical protein HY881_24615 [Deltaproteobacteria bacterium]|nr:hypothetical protein [Deltaproteobacteria bacterium]